MKRTDFPLLNDEEFGEIEHAAQIQIASTQVVVEKLNESDFYDHQAAGYKRFKDSLLAAGFNSWEAMELLKASIQKR